MGFKKIAVTIIGLNASAISEIRDVESKYGGVKIAVFSTCNTLVEGSDVEHLKKADIVCASASKIVREKIGSHALMQLGISIPVFILTKLGKKLALTYLSNVDVPLVVSRAKLPYIVEEKQPKLKVQHPWSSTYR